MRTKLLWHSNAPWAPTGYGMQTALVAPYLAERYDLTISAFYGLEGAPITWNDIPVLPGVGGAYGDEFLVQHARHTFDGDPRAGIVMTLMDVWVLDPTWIGQVNTACWVPIDHKPAPPQVTEFFERSGAIPIAMAKFGAEMLDCLDPLYVPHAVDTSVYRPCDRSEVRQRFGIPEDAFVVGMVAANKGRPSRKGFVQAFEAFARFAENHDNAILYLHTMVNPGLSAGENIPGILDALGVPKDKVRIAGQYAMLFQPYPASVMAGAYSALDVLLNPSTGEGFGVPVLEAQACGVPAIVTDFSAMPEVCGSGWHVSHRPYWSGLNSWQAIPDVDDIVNALEECAGRSPVQREKMAHVARKHALRYDTKRVMREHMFPALAEVERRFAARAPVMISSPGIQQVAA